MNQNAAKLTKNQDLSQLNQRGNVLVWILVFVALFAALSFTVSQGSRTGTQNISREQADLAATEILDYVSAVRRIVQELQINGCADTEINFANSIIQSSGIHFAFFDTPTAPNDNSCDVFHPNGGGLTFQKFPESAGFTGPSELGQYYTPFTVHAQGIGTDFTSGIDYINPTDLALSIQFTSEEVCRALNEKLGITQSGETVPDATGVLAGNTLSSQGRYNGTYLESVIIRTNELDILDGKKAACFYQGNPPIGFIDSARYVFYQILIAR